PLMNGLTSALIAMLLLIAARPSQAADTQDLLPNGDFERVVSTTQPANWQPLIIGAKSQFSLDEQEKHGGRYSAKIVAPEFARSYWRSDAIPVAPGEKIHASAWVKVKDVPPDHGSVIVIAEFSGTKGLGIEVAKVGTA